MTTAETLPLPITGEPTATTVTAAPPPRTMSRLPDIVKARIYQFAETEDGRKLLSERTDKDAAAALSEQFSVGVTVGLIGSIRTAFNIVKRAHPAPDSVDHCARFRALEQRVMVLEAHVAILTKTPMPGS